jgi:hypothetical protein
MQDAGKRVSCCFPRVWCVAGRGICGRAQCRGSSRAHPARRYEGGDKVSAVMREVDSVKGVMSDNINQAMSNLESAEDLNAKTEEMKNQSSVFNKQAKTAKNQQCMKNAKASL